MLKKIWRREVVLEHISFTYQDPSVFVKSQWQRTNGISLIYFAIRWSILVFFLTTWLISLIQAEHNTESNARWLIYLTNWGYTLCTAQAILSVIMITSALLTERRSCTKEDCLTGNLYKIYWAVNGIATVVAFGITVLFWSLIYEGGDSSVGAMNLIVHGFNSIMMFLDLWLVAHPVRLLHCYWTIVFGICYCLFSVVYYLAGGTDRLGSSAIYSILDWNKPGSTTIVCLGTLIFLVILHFVMYGIYRLRIYLVGLCKKEEKPSQTQSGIANSSFVPENA